MWVKICGIRDVETARLAAEGGADAIGLNFYTKSPRCVDVETAKAIIEALPEHVAAVGLFVNHSTAEVLRTLEDCATGRAPLIVQLHGDETPEEIADLQRERPDVRLIRAHRFTGDLEPLRRELAELAERDAMPTALLVDANVTGTYGGTGQTVPWAVLAESWDETEFPPLILAGGLTPENVAEATAIVRPWGVDTASGVESSPGVKDAEAMRRFVQAAKDADFS